MYTGHVACVSISPICATAVAPTYANSHISRPRSASLPRFISPAINASAPTLIANEPSDNSVCGGLTIFTSSPYALCHQLSNGADVSIATQPHTAMKAPRGPRNPQISTDVSLSVDSPPNVAFKIKYPHAIPTSTPVI